MNEPAVADSNPAVTDVTNENYLYEAGLVTDAASGLSGRNEGRSVLWPIY